MKKEYIVCLLIFTFCLVGAEASVSVKTLVETPKGYEETNVTTEGEVLDVLVQKQGTWINILDDGVSIGVWVEEDVRIPKIEYRGSYSQKGDIVKVQGTFYADCPQHLGTRDIHAEKVSLVSRGSIQVEEGVQAKRKQTIIWVYIFGASLVVYSVQHLLRKGKKKESKD